MQCLKPFTTKDRNGDEVKVPCNKCPQCAARRVSGWSFRLMQQNKIANSALFLTLTYDTKHVPLTKNGFMSLHKTTYTIKAFPNGKIKKTQHSSHLQSFFKRLRKAQYGSNKSDIKYYACGEYGGKTNRPHYHVILFNAKLELIQQCWDYGQIHYGLNVNEASVGYTLKYMSKPSRIPMHKNDDRVKEYAIMSKGIGKNYLTPAIIKFHNQSHEYMHCILPDGKKIAMPRYYKDKIYDEYTRIMFGKLGFQAMQEKKAKLLSRYGLSITDFEEKVQKQTDAYYNKQLKQSAERQKTF